MSKVTTLDRDWETKEGLSVNADIGFSYEVSEDHVKNIFIKHRKDAPVITDTYLRNIVRDAFNQEASYMPVVAVYGERKNEFIQNVNKKVNKRLSDEGFTLRQLSVIGTMRLPKSVEGALNSKIAATQKAAGS